MVKWFTEAFGREEGKTADFSGAIIPYDIKVDLCSQLNELYKYQRSTSFTDLGPWSHRFSSFKIFKTETAGLFETTCKLHVELSWGWEIKSFHPGFHP